MTAPVEPVVYLDADATRDAEFDEATHTWTAGGRSARVVVATDGTLPSALTCRMEHLRPYLGVAVHGVPNWFLVTGPDAAAQKGYIAKCLDYLERSDATRIEVRAGTQRTYDGRSRGRNRRGGHYWRKVGRRIPSSFEVRFLGFEDGPEDSVFDGAATVAMGDRVLDAKVRLTGRIDPIDGHYHWQGTVFAADVDVRLPLEVTVTIGDRSARGRLTERTPWSTFSVVGLGAPPFALEAVEVDVPLL
ncbi:DUF4873 domain-containing protein [Mycolicibacterium iranicum]|uniref:DUF4873 domain-containing protein n=1 Tax=Mycolicibacterium iranicum TaxID=912594 RepID=A0A1X1W3Z9_MYCIR|nr:DUF4873 domain-containing protein [Mycolicibacterium iranicum]MCZ0732081.1 DUF4873 domain-containing protein [Mycolicibacterium iranicum]ORV81294.1 hypothetical protein AWC12_28985 [Mycolicibacterium iranicum]